MLVRVDSIAFACFHRSCAPPPTGTGGSKGSAGRSPARKAARAKARYDQMTREGASASELKAMRSRADSLAKRVKRPAGESTLPIRPPSREERNSRAGTLYGKGIDALFTGPSAKVPNPLPAARRRKGEPAYDQASVQAALNSPVRLTKVDPRTLRSSQREVTRPGVSYYTGNEYKTTGRTYADQNQKANQYPVVYHNRRTDELVLLTGNHRAAAALVNGESLDVIYVS